MLYVMGSSTPIYIYSILLVLLFTSLTEVVVVLLLAVNCTSYNTKPHTLSSFMCVAVR